METLEKRLRETWTPRAKDKECLHHIFRALGVGCVWADPKGYIFRKTGPHTLELEMVAGTYKDGRVVLGDGVAETLIMTKIIGEELGITVKLEHYTLVTLDVLSSVISRLINENYELQSRLLRMSTG